MSALAHSSGTRMLQKHNIFWTNSCCVGWINAWLWKYSSSSTLRSHPRTLQTAEVRIGGLWLNSDFMFSFFKIAGIIAEPPVIRYDRGINGRCGIAVARWSWPVNARFECPTTSSKSSDWPKSDVIRLRSPVLRAVCGLRRFLLLILWCQVCKVVLMGASGPPQPMISQIPAFL